MTNEERNCLIIESWNDVVEGRSHDAIPKMNLLIEEESSGYNSRGIAYLMIGEFAKAKDDLLQGSDRFPHPVQRPLPGVAMWLANNREEACAYWSVEFELQKSGRMSHVADGAGVLGPVLFWWASLTLGKRDSALEALKQIKKRSKTVAYSREWAGPIGEFVLDKLTANELLQCTTAPSGLTPLSRQRLCQAYFYIAFKRYLDGDMHGYYENLKHCTDPSAIRTPEFHLARKELSLLPQ